MESKARERIVTCFMVTVNHSGIAFFLHNTSGKNIYGKHV